MTDAIDIGTVTLTPADVRGFAVTTAITALTTSANGLNIQFAKKDGPGWPDIKPEGWDGPVYYTIYVGAALGDGVHLAAALNVYRGEGDAVGGDVTNLVLRANPALAQGQYPQNLWYLDGALGQHAAVEGETLYLMVVAGGWRGVKAVSVAERSNIVKFTASSSPRSFTFADVPVVPPVVPPTPPVVPPTPPVDPPTPPVDPPMPDVITAILAQLARIEAAVTAKPATQTAPDYTGTVTARFIGVAKVELTPVKK